MKIKFLSLISVIVICITFTSYRISYCNFDSDKYFKATSWDALGYYYLTPGIYIYHDIKKLDWLMEIDTKYELSGDSMYQISKHKKTGNYVGKYLGGVSILQTPFFFIGHIIANYTNKPTDGFSQPYQYAIVFGSVFYFILSMFLLRKILLFYFSDTVVSISLLLLSFGTNLIQYISIDSAMSHAYIFPLYVFVVYATHKWHENPQKITALSCGIAMGLATICRPTELIIFLIPLLWGMQNKENYQKKILLVKKNINHIVLLIFGFIVGILPQLIYWQIVTDFFVYDPGSKWSFLTPNIQVLFGFTNGWFVYTPITILFVIGFFFIKSFPFRKSVIVFCLINIYIVISWFDWKYGATFSTRALVQSYPVFALSLAAMVDKILSTKWTYVFIPISVLLVALNFFQIYQYNHGIIHYRDMNMRYYSRIFLKFQLKPEYVSLLDTKDFVANENNYNSKTLFQIDSTINFNSHPDTLVNLMQNKIESNEKNTSDKYLKIETELIINNGFDKGYLFAKLESKQFNKYESIRLSNILCAANIPNRYALYFKIPNNIETGVLTIGIHSKNGIEGKSLKIICKELILK